MKEKEQNEKALKILEQQYKGFIDQQNNWDFFRGLAEYTKTVQEMTQTKPFIEALEARRELARKSYEMMSSEAMKELTKSAQRLTAVAQDTLKQYKPSVNEAQKQMQKLAKQYEPIIKAVQEVQDQVAGRILSSRPLHSFNSALFDVARFVRASGNEKAVKEFEDNKRQTKNIYGNYTFSPTYEKIDNEEQQLKRKEQVEPWGAWQQLPIVKEIVFEPDEVKKELKVEVDKNLALQWTYLNFIGVAGEMEKIREGKGSDNDIVIFRVKDYRSYAQRIHNFLTTELIKFEHEQEKLDFDETSRVLYFMGERIVISKKEESDSHKLTRTLFKDIHKVWANDEILEDWGYDFDEETPKDKVYKTSVKVNGIVAQDTKIKDFLIFSTKTVSINRKYLTS